MRAIYEKLANAIIIRAVQDYRIANKKLAKNPKNMDARLLKTELVEFFNSGLFAKLSDLDGLELIKRLEDVR